MSHSLFRALYVTRRDIVPALAKEILSNLQTPLSNQMLASLSQGPNALVSTSVDPKGYASAEDFRRDYLATEMFSKYPKWDLGIDRQKVALEKFKESEDQCRITNTRFRSPRAWPYGTAAVVHTACRKIQELLGPFNWNEAVLGFDFGPGSTTRLPRKRSDRYYKFSGIPEVSHNCLPLADAALSYFKLWGQSVKGLGKPLVVCQGNKVVTVPKNAKTDRVIAIEPCMNIFIQKGIGGVIRRRLRKVGINLNDQSKNQELARAGSIDDDLVTIDLSSASDTISYEVVKALLPPDWFDALCACRSEKGVLPSGEVVLYRKFSSMGNGFTFELESLIFWAICSAVRSLNGESDRRLAIYGDDIIVPTGMAAELVTMLQFFGFTVNTKKSHLSGPFRESCGKHFFLGDDVTPIYVRESVDSYPRYIWLCNQLKRWSWNRVYGLDPLLKGSWDLSRSQLSGFWSKPLIPDGMGDGALIGDFDEVKPKRASRQMQGYVAKFFGTSSDMFLPDDPPILLKSLWTLEKSPKAGSYPTVSKYAEAVDAEPGSQLGIPLQKRKYSLATRAVWQWKDLGPWLD